MKATSKVSRLRRSKRIPNIATFSSMARGYDTSIHKGVVEVVLFGIKKPRAMEFKSRHGFGRSTVEIDPARANIGQWVYAITQTAGLNNNWNDSVLRLVEDTKLWVGHLQGSHQV
jgi:hypothetical protein